MKLIFTVILGFITYLGNSQSIEQGKKELYYDRLASAKQTFQQVIQQYPENGEAWFNLAKLYVMLDQLQQASDTLQAAPEAARKDPFFKVAEGISFVQKNSKDQAAVYFDDIMSMMKKRNENLAAAIAWVQINMPGGNPEYAINILNKAIKKSKHNPELYVLLGDAWRKRTDGTEAFKAYQNAINKDKNYAVAYYRIGQIFLSQKNKEVYSDYFRKAVTADPEYSPAWYKLYVYEFSRNPAKSLEYYTKYTQNADQTIQMEYDIIDLYYLNQEYNKAIDKANALISAEQKNTKPRIYKLIAYSYAGKNDTSAALTAMKQYFANEQDSNIIAKDYEAMSAYYLSLPDQDSLAADYLAKAAALEQDSAARFDDYKKLADMAKAKKDYEAQAKWLEKFCEGNPAASNLDLFYWGIANYRIENYLKADTVFGIYSEKYPDQSFGYYWQAKSKALQDTNMSAGLAVPVYEKLIEVLDKNPDDENYKKWISEAYSYLAAYAANTQKDYVQAISYFEKVLTIDPENAMAKKYIDILDRQVKKASNTDNSSIQETNSE